jgi:hypothetical protein
MKKIVPIGLLGLASIDLIAQKKTYLITGLGYGLPNGRRTLTVQSNDWFGTSGGYQQVVAGSYGGGLLIHSGFIRTTETNWSWGLEANYLIGKKVKAKIDASLSNGASARALWSGKSNQFYIAPFLLRNFAPGRKLTPYASVGLIFSKPMVKIESSYVIKNVNSPSTANREEIHLRHRLSVGSRVSFGFSMEKGKSRFFSDFSFCIMNPWWKESEKDGQVTTYEKKIKSGSQEELADTSPFGSVGVSLGYWFILEAKK